MIIVGLMHRQRRFAAALQMTQSPVEQIVDINIARLQIGIVQLAVLLAEVGQHLIPRPLRIALFLAQDIAGGFIEIRVVEQRVMAGENGRDIGRIALFRQGGQRIEIVQRLADRLLQAPLFVGDVGAGLPDWPEGRQRIAERFALNTRGDGGKNRWRGVRAARQSSPLPAPEMPPAPLRHLARGPAALMYRCSVPATGQSG